MSLLCSFLSVTHGFMRATKTSVLLDVSKALFPSADLPGSMGLFIHAMFKKMQLSKKLLFS